MRSIINKKKKYDLFTIIIVVISLTTLSIGALVLANFIGGENGIGGELRDTATDMANDGFISSENANYSTDFIKNDTTKFADNYVFWLFVGTFIGLMLTAMYLEFEPSVMIIIFIFGSIAVLGAWLGASIHTEFSEDLPTESAEMSKTAILMSSPYFPIFIFVGLIVMMVIMYQKKRAGEYQ